MSHNDNRSLILANLSKFSKSFSLNGHDYERLIVKAATIGAIAAALAVANFLGSDVIPGIDESSINGIFEMAAATFAVKVLTQWARNNQAAVEVLVTK